MNTIWVILRFSDILLIYDFFVIYSLFRHADTHQRVSLLLLASYGSNPSVSFDMLLIM